MEPNKPTGGTRRASGAVLPGYHLWEAPGKPVSIYIALDVVDRISQEVLRAFSAVPKRGAEIGGLLLGSVGEGEPLNVRIEDFEAIDCQHKFGPSYILSELDQQNFDEAYLRYLAADDSPLHVVGYFRSHTRDGLSLGAEDVELCRQLFSKTSDVVLLIKPFATRVSMAGFLFKESGKFQDEPYVQFPFRRRDMDSRAPEEPVVRDRSAGRVRDRTSYPVKSRAQEPGPVEELVEYAEPPPAYMDPSYPAGPMPTDAGGSKFRSGWVWLPLSFIFLLLGVLLGFQAALTIGSRTATGASQATFALGLAVTQTDDNLHINWDRQSAPIRSSSHGLLEIEDGSYNKTINLDASQLQNGSVIYRHLADAVMFRLTVYPTGRITVTEKYTWTKGE
jgi:hypothetical protein